MVKSSAYDMILMSGGWPLDGSRVGVSVLSVPCSERSISLEMSSWR